MSREPGIEISATAPLGGELTISVKSEWVPQGAQVDNVVPFRRPEARVETVTSILEDGRVSIRINRDGRLVHEFIEPCRAPQREAACG